MKTTTDCRTADKRAAAPSMETAARTSRTQRQAQSHPQGKPETTLGSSLFYDPLAGAGGLGDIRHRLELKYTACLVIGGPNACPIDVDRIKDNRLRALAAGGMIFKDWSVKDLTACTGDLEGAAASVLVATLERPVWGPDDFRLMYLIERMEQMRGMAMRGGRTL